LLRELRGAANYLLEQEFPLRSHEVWPDDVFLVSYPKSGNTWVRFLLGNLVRQGGGVSFLDIGRVVPDIAGLARKDFRRLARPRVIKSHDCFDPRYRRVVYIVRDPRDVAVSSYYYAQKMRNISDATSMHAYITTDFMGRADYSGTWGEHVGSWLINPQIAAAFSALNRALPPAARLDELGARGHGRQFLLVRYEDLLEDTETGLARIARFIGVDATPDGVHLAVEQSSARNMRRLESAQSEQWVTTRKSRKDIQFVREATSGQWRQSLARESVAAIECAWGFLMELLGYKRAE
jgi:hypothetical protein